MNQSFHSIEAEKKKRRDNFFQNHRKSHWQDLDILCMEKNRYMLHITEMLYYYANLQGFEEKLRAALSSNANYMALKKLATADIKLAKETLEQIQTEFKGKTGRVGLEDLPAFLSHTEKIFAQDDILHNVSNVLLPQLSDIFKITTTQLANSGA